MISSSHRRSQPLAYSPWGAVPLAPRPSQPFAVQTDGSSRIPTASLGEFGDLSNEAFSVPFWPWPIRECLRNDRLLYGSNRSEGPIPDETKSGARPRNLTARDGNAC